MKRLHFATLLWWLAILPSGTAIGGTVRTFAGEFIDGHVDLNGAAISVTPPGQQPVTVPLPNILDAVFDNWDRPFDKLSEGLMLVNGSEVAGFPRLAPDGKTLQVDDRSLGVPITAAAWLVYDDIDRKAVSDASNGRTGACLPGGDFLPGAFTGIIDDRPVISSVLFGVQHLIPRTAVLAVVLRNVQPTARYEIKMRPGSMYMTDDLKVNGDTLDIRDSILGNIQIPRRDIAEIRAGSGRYLYLTDLKPFRVDQPATLPSGKPAVEIPKDEANTLRIAANASVSYAVPAGCSVFSAQVEPGKDAAPFVRLTFSVYADGMPLARSASMSAADKPQALRAAFNSARFITLRVEPASPGSAGVWGKWSAPMLLRP